MFNLLQGDSSYDLDGATPTSTISMHAQIGMVLAVATLICFILLLTMCMCFEQPKWGLRLSIKQAQDYFKKRGLLPANDTNNNSSKNSMNGSLHTLSVSSKPNGCTFGRPGNGYTSLNGNHSPNLAVSNGVLSPDRQMSRDRELPPVPSSTQAANQCSCTETGAGDYEVLPPTRWSKSNLCHGDRSEDESFEAVDKCGADVPCGGVVSDNGQVLSYYDSNCDTEVDPLYATVTPLLAGQTNAAPTMRTSLIGRAGSRRGASWLARSSMSSTAPNSNKMGHSREETSSPTYSIVERNRTKPPTPLYAKIRRPGNEQRSPWYPSTTQPTDSIQGDNEALSMRQSDSYASIAGPPIPTRAYGQSEIDLVTKSNEIPDTDLTDTQSHGPGLTGGSGLPLRRPEGALSSEALPGSPRRFSQPVMASTPMVAPDNVRHSMVSPGGPPPSSSISTGQLASNGPPRGAAARTPIGCSDGQGLTQVYEGVYEGLYYSSEEVTRGRNETASRNHDNVTVRVSNDSGTDPYAEIGDMSAVRQAVPTVRFLAETAQFRHMDSDVDVSKSASSTSLNGFLQTWHGASSRLTVPTAVPSVALATCEDRDDDSGDVRDTSLLCGQKRPIMTPLMERSIEGSLFEELRNNSDGTMTPNSDNYSLLDDLLTCEQMFSSSYSSRGEDREALILGSLTRSLRDRTESEASSML